MQRHQWQWSHFLAQVQIQKQIQPSPLEAGSFESLQSPHEEQPSMLAGQATPSLLFPLCAPAVTHTRPVCVGSYQKREGSCVFITSFSLNIASLSALSSVLSKLVAAYP